MITKRKIFVGLSWVAVAALMIFIFSMSAANGDESQKMSDSLLDRIIEMFSLPVTSHFIRKTAHFCEFALLSFLTGNAVFTTFGRKNAPVIAFLVSSLYGVFDEIHQLFSDGRSCQIKDMIIDSSGAILGAVIYFVIILIYIKHIERKKDNGSIKTL